MTSYGITSYGMPSYGIPSCRMTSYRMTSYRMTCCGKTSACDKEIESRYYLAASFTRYRLLSDI